MTHSTRDSPVFPALRTPENSLLRAPTRSSLYLGLLEPVGHLCASCLALVQPATLLCLCLPFSWAAAYPVTNLPSSIFLPRVRLFVPYIPSLCLSLSVSLSLSGILFLYPSSPRYTRWVQVFFSLFRVCLTFESFSSSGT